MFETSKREQFLLALYVSLMVMANTLGVKVASFGPIRASVGIFFMPWMFTVTDIVGEVRGRDRASFFVKVSEAILVIYVLAVLLCIWMKPNPTWGAQDAYIAVFGSTVRMTLASIVSFFISQNLDVCLFFVIRKICGGRKLWIRNNVATIVSQLADTLVFEYLAFWRLTPKFTASFVLSMALPYWALKVIFALCDTPLCYLGVRWLRSGDTPSLSEGR